MMKHLTFFTASALAVVLALDGTASAQVLTTARCQNAFSVGLDIAQRRYAWGQFCRTNATTMGRNPEHYLSQMSIDDYNATPVTTPTVDRPYIRAQLFPTYFDYVTFGVWDIPDGSLSTAPNPTTPPTSTTVCAVLPTSSVNAGLCVAGCYVEGTPLLFADGPMGIKAAAEAGKADLVTLSPEATLDNVTLVDNTVDRYVADLVDSVQAIHTITMQSGGQLRVTSEHPLLDSDGIIRQAQALVVGNQLVRADGQPDPIVSITVAKENTKVWNVRPVTTDYVSNLLVAGGYINGSLRYQNEFLSAINSLILRRALAAQADNLTR
jgi:hypothetical protein